VINYSQASLKAMTVDQLLSSLHDIHPPMDASWWPLAGIWWVLLAAPLLLIGGYALYRKRRNVYRFYAQANTDLQRISTTHQANPDDQQLALNLSRWLRQVALLAYPDKAVAAITGQSWLNLLDAGLASAEFSEGVGQVFAAEVYAPNTKISADNLLNLCNRWLASVKLDLLMRARRKAC
jgi:hypothetical protein